MITPDGKTAYVMNQSSNTVTPIATATNTPGRPIHVGQGVFPLTALAARRGRGVAAPPPAGLAYSWVVTALTSV